MYWPGAPSPPRAPHLSRSGSCRRCLLLVAVRGLLAALGVVFAPFTLDLGGHRRRLLRECSQRGPPPHSLCLEGDTRDQWGAPGREHAGTGDTGRDAWREGSGACGHTGSGAEALRGLTLAGVRALSLSDSSLLLSESSSAFPVWTLRAADPAFPGPLPEDPWLTVEAGLT